MMTPQQEADCLNYNPFSADDNSIRMLSDHMVTARKEGPCCICFEAIRSGERARKQTAIVDNRMRSCRMCEACCIAMAMCWVDGGKAIEERTGMGMRKVGALP